MRQEHQNAAASQTVTFKKQQAEEETAVGVNSNDSTIIKVRKATNKHGKVYQHILQCRVPISDACFASRSQRLTVIDSAITSAAGEATAHQKAHAVSAYLKQHPEIVHELRKSKNPLTPSDKLTNTQSLKVQVQCNLSSASRRRLQLELRKYGVRSTNL